ncbi:LlaJI restriction endonuclease [Fontibacillus phaseoli]|uniref:LlaJI restriction endonuclease n=2 Tax=Fontibacillus phaseoli TaxID=1416533 RepID=A0A369B4U1_9BACL|nr:LlaJI restriction endonuclease [Fontibacillus phaseoli]
MKAAFFKELRRYSGEEIASLLQIKHEETISLIRKLKSLGIVKEKMKRALETDVYEKVLDMEILDVNLKSQNSTFIFDYVGVINIGNYVIKCYPKYISEVDVPLKEMKQILHVLRKYNSKEQLLISASGDDENVDFNLLPIILFFIDDYSENGIYTNPIEINELNGEGEINWEKTIGETYPLLSNNKAYYTEMYTHGSLDDELDYFKQLHECIVTECFLKLKKLGLLELFDIETAILYDGELSDFGDEDYILYRLARELAVQFQSRKQLVLKTIYNYIFKGKLHRRENGISLFGTNSFNLVWEKVCSDVFNNQLQTKLKHLSLPQTLSEQYSNDKDNTLLGLIEKPKWNRVEEGRVIKTHRVEETLIPDIISIYSIADGECFGIFDAKYYNIYLDENRIVGQPGIGDITKQYLYQLAYNDFIKAHNFTKIQNAFLMPTEKAAGEYLGTAELNMLNNLSLPALCSISVVQLPAQKMFSWYLAGSKIDISSVFTFL